MKPVRWSDLKWMAKSPAHFRYYRDEPFAPNDAMRIGGRVHSLLLGRNKFVTYSGIRRGKAWAQFVADTPSNIEIVNERESEVSECVADSLRANRDAMKLLTQGDVEQRIEWTTSTAMRSAARMIPYLCAHTFVPIQ